MVVCAWNCPRCGHDLGDLAGFSDDMETRCLECDLVVFEQRFISGDGTLHQVEECDPNARKLRSDDDDSDGWCEACEYYDSRKSLRANLEKERAHQRLTEG